MRTFVNGPLILEYVSDSGNPAGASVPTDCDAMSPSSAMPRGSIDTACADQAGPGIPTIHIKSDRYGKAVLFVKRTNAGNDSVQDLQPFDIRTRTDSCVIVVANVDRHILYKAIMPQAVVTATPNHRIPSHFCVSRGEQPGNDLHILLMSYSLYRKSMQYKCQSRKIHWLLHTKLNSLKSNGQDFFSRYIASFIASEITKITCVSLMEVDRETHEVIYKIDGSIGQDQAYRIPFPKDGALDLTDVRDPNNPHHFLSVSSIAPYAFWNYRNLTSIVIPESMIVFGKYAFYGCDCLKSVVDLGSVHLMNQDGQLSRFFSDNRYMLNYTPIRRATLPSRFYRRMANANQIREFIFYANVHVDYMSCDGGLVIPAKARSENIIIPAGVTQIYDSAVETCYWCRGLYNPVESIVIPESMITMNPVKILRTPEIGFPSTIYNSGLRAIKCTRRLYNRSQSVFHRLRSTVAFVDLEGKLISSPYTTGIAVSAILAALLTAASVAVGCCMIPFDAMAALIVVTAVTGGLALGGIGTVSGLSVMRHRAVRTAKALQSSTARAPS